MAAKNLYAVLGVDEKAGPEELRRAWLRLAVKHHPDRNPGDAKAEERFKNISQAYALLSDPAARARYERTRPKPAKPRAAGPRPAGPKPEPSKPEPPKPEPSKPEPQDRAAEAKPEEPRAEDPRAENSRAEDPRVEDPRVEDSSEWAEILKFFQTPKGRDTLKELEEELRRAGLKLSSGPLARWLRTRRTTAPEKARGWLKSLRGWLPGGPAWTRARAARYDLSYDLALSPEALARGTTVEISYYRDEGRRQEVKINLPAGLKNGARLRLPDQGLLRPDGGRGDLVLTVKGPEAIS
jgi:curved DNA-binding protein CbpA